VGIGRPEGRDKEEVSAYVLRNVTQRERKVLLGCEKHVLTAVQQLVIGEFQKAEKRKKLEETRKEKAEIVEKLKEAEGAAKLKREEALKKHRKALEKTMRAET